MPKAYLLSAPRLTSIRLVAVETAVSMAVSMFPGSALRISLTGRQSILRATCDSQTSRPITLSCRSLPSLFRTSMTTYTTANQLRASRRVTPGLRSNLDRYYKWAKTHNSLLIVTFDENDDKDQYH